MLIVWSSAFELLRASVMFSTSSDALYSVTTFCNDDHHAQKKTKYNYYYYYRVSAQRVGPWIDFGF